MFLTPAELLTRIDIFKLKIQKKESELPTRFGPGGPTNDDEAVIYDELYELNHELHKMLDLATDLY